MKWSKSFLFTSKDSPSDAEIPSHKLMMRAGMLKKVGPGLYTYQYLGLRAIRKFEGILREELNSLDCQEVLMPMVQPKSLWEETNRWSEMGDLLLKMQNRNEQWFCLGGTHEEVITDLIRHDIQSYKHLPQIIYQIQTKYRDEIRPRFGLMRGREFIMKDAYSFDVDEESALKSYDIMFEVYQKIFKRLGAEFRVVEADAGNIGGSKTHEFQLLADAGEDHLMVCDSCDFAANIEVAPTNLGQIEAYDGDTNSSKTEKISTPNLRTIKDLSKFLKIEEKFLVKTLFYKADDKVFCVLLRGSDDLNEIKLKNALGLVNPPQMLEPEEVKKLTSAMPGSCGPIGLKIPIYVDGLLRDYKNFVVGANEDDFHFKGVNFKDFEVGDYFDLRKVKDEDLCPKCNKGKYKSFRGIEVGHCFYLGTKYSKAMNATYLDANGKTKFIEMGCYGIGVGRSVQAAIEQSHDKDGIVWPKSISPFDVHICHLDPANGEVDAFVQELYQGLQKAGLDVFMDDRKERPGVKFKDADLLGFPLRITVGAKGYNEGVIEVHKRKSKESLKIERKDPQKMIENLVGIVAGL